MSKLLSILALLAVVGLAIGSARLILAGANNEPPPVGDVNCDGSVDPIDALTILRYDAGLGTNQPQGCQPLGSGGHPVASAINDLAMRLGVAPGSIVVLEVREVQWPDPCLGVYDGGLCVAIPVPGYWILLGAAGEDYDYRADCFGEIIKAADFVGPDASVVPPPEPSPGACS